MVDTVCLHTWRGVSATHDKWKTWKVLEQCKKCGQYREITENTND